MIAPIDILAGVLLAVGLAGLGVLVGQDLRTRLQRRARLAGGGGAGEPAPGAFQAVAERVRRLGDRVEALDAKESSALRGRLAQAGFPGREAVAYYLGLRAVILAAAVIVTLAVEPLAARRFGPLAGVLAALLLTGTAVFGPDQVLRSRRGAREQEYRDGFPDLLDLLVASVQAGLSLDAAVSRITAELAGRYPRLAEHLYLMTLEFRAGQTRKDAWSRFAGRVGIEEARAFATMLRQAEDMGVSLSDTLSVFSEDMRQKRMLKAEEKALALPAKMMIPLILFIFPCLIGVLMLPAGVKIAHAFH